MLISMNLSSLFILSYYRNAVSQNMRCSWFIFCTYVQTKKHNVSFHGSDLRVYLVVSYANCMAGVGGWQNIRHACSLTHLTRTVLTGIAL